MLFRILDLLFFYFFLHVDTIESSNKLKDKIQKAGSVVIKISQWYCNIQYYKYDDDHRPLILDYIKEFQYNIRSVRLSKNEISEVTHKYPCLISIDATSMACGTIGHIHKAYDIDGNTYIVKIRHSSIVKELNFFKKFSYLFDSSLIDYLYAQVDFRIEANNMNLLYGLYGNERAVRIPKIYYYDETILIMEFISSKHNPLQDDIFHVITIKLWIIDMIVYHGMMHGDIHNGNWGIGDDDYVVMYDWGVIYREKKLVDLVFSFFDRDQDLLKRTLIIFFPSMDDLKISDWIEEWKNNDFQLGKDVTKRLIEIIRPCFGMNKETLMFINFINFFSLLDQFTFIKETDLTEVRKFQLALLRSKNSLPNMQMYLENKLFQSK